MEYLGHLCSTITAFTRVYSVKINPKVLSFSLHHPCIFPVKISITEKQGGLGRLRYRTAHRPSQNQSYWHSLGRPLADHRFLLAQLELGSLPLCLNECGLSMLVFILYHSIGPSRSTHTHTRRFDICYASRKKKLS